VGTGALVAVVALALGACGAPSASPGRAGSGPPGHYPYTEVGVPALVGLRLDAAERSARRADLTMVVRRRFAAGVPAGRVAAQQPSQGTVVGERAVVTVTVSAGPPHPARSGPSTTPKGS